MGLDAQGRGCPHANRRAPHEMASIFLDLDLDLVARCRRRNEDHSAVRQPTQTVPLEDQPLDVTYTPPRPEPRSVSPATGVASSAITSATLAVAAAAPQLR
jgi:hypothetical protein